MPVSSHAVGVDVGCEDGPVGLVVGRAVGDADDGASVLTSVGASVGPADDGASVFTWAGASVRVGAAVCVALVGLPLTCPGHA